MLKKWHAQRAVTGAGGASDWTLLGGAESRLRCGAKAPAIATARLPLCRSAVHSFAVSCDGAFCTQHRQPVLDVASTLIIVGGHTAQGRVCAGSATP